MAGMNLKSIHWPTVLTVLVVLALALFIYHHTIGKKAA